MSKEWVLNIAFHRWQLNRPKYVGRLAEAIRVCAPGSKEEWERYYYEQVPKKHVPSGWQMFGRTMAEHLEEVGRRLFAKISEQLRKEVEEVTEEDCIAYVREVVMHRTYAGYVTEKQTVYEQLEHLLGVKLQPTPDSWDRRYSVDCFIPIGNRYIGIQVKPITYSQTLELYKWQQWMQDAHERFCQDHGGRVFIVFSVTERGGRKRIWNTDVLGVIRQEIQRLRGTTGPEA